MEDLPQLPPGLSFDDLRFVDPELYSLSMAMKGWWVHLQPGIDGNEAGVSYTLVRPVSEAFGLEQLGQLAENIGIVRDNKQLEGYRLFVDVFAEEEPLLRAIDQYLNPHMQGRPLLIFNFTGFPTEKTMSVLQALEGSFNEQIRKSKARSLLGSLVFWKR